MLPVIAILLIRAFGRRKVLRTEPTPKTEEPLELLGITNEPYVGSTYRLWTKPLGIPEAKTWQVTKLDVEQGVVWVESIVDPRSYNIPITEKLNVDDFRMYSEPIKGFF